MIKKDYLSLIKEIRGIYPEFQGNEDLLNYKYTDVKKNFLLHTGEEAPTYQELTEGLNYENDDPVVMMCEYCKEKELVSDTNQWLEKHRVCQKIDFIDRQSKKIRGVGINKLKYYQMSSYELEKNYRKVMEHYLENKDKGTQFYERI